MGAPFTGALTTLMGDRGVGQTDEGDFVLIAYAGSLSGAAEPVDVHRMPIRRRWEASSSSSIQNPRKPVTCIERRYAPDGLMYTRAQFFAWYRGDSTMWDLAPPVESHIITVPPPVAFSAAWRRGAGCPRAGERSESVVSKVGDLSQPRQF